MLDRKSVPHLSIQIWVCCLIMVYCCALLYVLPPLQRLWVTFQAKNNIQSASATYAVLHLPKSRTEAITFVPQIVTYAVREKGMKLKEEQT